MTGPRFITIDEAASLARVEPSVLADLIDEGKIPVVETPEGDRRIPVASLLASVPHVIEPGSLQALGTAVADLTEDDIAKALGTEEAWARANAREAIREEPWPEG